ncbi:MAG TPA: Crp/Fnr family transcriptional regulator [Candidatus Sphingobacterium stercorigallinarum]|nr:Crp/Fnr family transcriptional regulator [Candidatus Sphingobacterium stercorigallinarum]
MIDKLAQHIRKIVDLSANEEAELSDFFDVRTFDKKEKMLEAGSRCNDHFFIVEGCARMFFVNSKGVEHTVQFAIENWWITDYSVFGRHVTTDFFIQGIERTEVLVINFQRQEELYRRMPKIERYFRLIYQRAYAASQFRTKYLFGYSKEQIYRHFNDAFPDFTGRVPQHLLASYLNMTPEYLSEIKNKVDLNPD